MVCKMLSYQLAYPGSTLYYVVSAIITSLKKLVLDAYVKVTQFR